MADFSSSSHASSSSASTSFFPEFMQDVDFSAIDLPNGETRDGPRHQNQDSDGATTSQPADIDAVLDGFFDFGDLRMDDFDLNTIIAQTDFSMLEALGIGEELPQQNLGMGAEPMLGGGDLTFDIGTFDINALLGMDTLPHEMLDPGLTMLGSEPVASSSNHEATNELPMLQQSEDWNTFGTEDDWASAVDSNAPAEAFPARDPCLRIHTPPESTEELVMINTTATNMAEAAARDASSSPSTSQEPNSEPLPRLNGQRIPREGFPGYPMPRDADGNLHPAVMSALNVHHHASRAAASSARASKAREDVHRSNQSRHEEIPYNASIEEKKERKRLQKAKANGQPIWRVYTAPVPPAEASSGNASSSGNGSGPTDSNAISSGSGTATSSTIPVSSTSSNTGKRPGKRKDVFHHVEPPSADKNEKNAEKLEWCKPVPPWDPSSLLQQKPRNKPKTPETHSEMGWVMARLREPGCERPQYGWAIAQIHDPRENLYFVLSGPHVTKLKTVRPYDRICYSSENVEKLKERCLSGVKGKGPGAKGEKVYDTVNTDPAELERNSTALGENKAAGAIWSIPKRYSGR